MTTTQPEDSGNVLGTLWDKIAKLQVRNIELVSELMRQSAELSEAKEKLKRWQTELEILADQKGHNLCWVGIPKLLKNTIGYTGVYPDTQGVIREEFRTGCDIYIDDIFGKSGPLYGFVKDEKDV